MSSIYNPVAPVIMFLSPEYTSMMYVRMEPGQTEEALAGLETVFKQFNPGYPFDFTFLDEEFEATYRSETVLGKLANLFTLIAIFISCLGLFGLISFSAEQRTKEIGVRKVLGAGVARLVMLLAGEITKLVLVGVVIAIPIAYLAVNNWLTRFVYHVDMGVGLFLLAGAAAVLIAWFTVSYQAVKAALADPVKSLRYE
jgi:ABC-type antimicrobial peptide transport system permease subunit